MSYRSCDGVYHSEPLSEYCEEVLKAPPGHFWFSTPDADGTRYIHMKLPSNRDDGAYCAIPVREGPKQTGAWQWDGNLERPTLSPSIFHDFDHPTSSVSWHGFLRAGPFRGVLI